MKVKVTTLNISGVTTSYGKLTWVQDDDEPDGGYYKTVKVMYKTPKVKLNFVGTTDVDLEIGGRYYDGANIFVATEKNRIQNVYESVETFSIPKEVILVARPPLGERFHCITNDM